MSSIPRLSLLLFSSVVIAAFPAAAKDCGFYRVAQDGAGAWRLTDPSGRPTLWLGVDHVKFNGFRCEAEGNRMRYREANIKKFVTRAAWASNTVQRLRSWGFNALGAGCDNADFKGMGLGRAVFLAIGDSATGEKDDHEHYLAENLHVPGTAFPNVFAADFAERCDKAAAKTCAANRDDPEVLGYFIDNELAWEGRNRGATRPWGLFDAACAKPAGNSARKAVEEFLSKRGKKVGDEVPVSVKLEFVGMVAERYFSATTAAIRKHDPNHLVLGCRFAGAIVPDVVWQAAGRHCDIVSLNAYARAELERGTVTLQYQDGYLPIGDALSRISELSKRPVMITEWSFPAFDSGLPCSRGAGQRFDTQIERARASELYARAVLSLKCVVGYDYFMWVDMPAKGISLGFPEDTNYGLVREDGTEYRELVEALSKAQGAKGESRPAFLSDSDHSAASCDVLAEIYDPVTNLSARPPSFMFSDGAYRVRNGAGLEIRGRIGGTLPIEKILLRGKESGSLSVMVQSQGAYNPKSRSGYVVASHRVKRVEGVAWREEGPRGILSLKCDMGVASLGLEISVGPESQNLIADVKRVDNTGAGRLAVDKVLLLPISPCTEAVVPKKGPSPSFMNVPHCVAAWMDRASGRYLGVLTDSLFTEVIDFWKDKSGGRHPDVCFSPNRHAHGGRLVIGPGESWVPEAPLHALLRVGVGGEKEWDEFSRRVPRVAVRPDFSKVAGKIKPVNGVGQPPFLGRNYSLIPRLKEAHVPYSRLHDVGGAVTGQGLYVDIPNVFKNFDADPADPASYDFAFSDDLLKAIVTNGIAPYFRLGVSIENYAGELGARKIFPPKDNLKWARICEGVVRHYTEGWANGFKWKIDYWEIWNEPDGEAPPEKNSMWRGTFAQYLDLYGTAQRHLKARFPHLQFGGYGSCGFEALCSNWKPERTSHHMRCFGDFLSYVKKNGCAPDFFSFHCYGPWWKIEKQAKHARCELDKAGLKNVPIHLTEWLSSHGNGTAKQTAILADTLVRLQGSPVDLAEIYDARCGSGMYSPLFDPSTWRPRKGYYAFRAFGELYARGREVSTSCSCGEIAALAAVDGNGSAALMVVNPSAQPRPFFADFGGRRVKSVHVTDDSRDWSETDCPHALTPWSVWLFQL